MQNTSTKTRKLVEIAMLGAIAAVLMYFEFPLPFIAPPFYEIDLSEVPVMIGAFALGPGAGALIELVKILLKLLLKGTTTAFIGDIANYIIGCFFVIPAALIYKSQKTKKRALLGMIFGTLFMTVAGCLLNVYVLLPAFGMSADAVVEMGAAINENIHDIFTFAALVIAPFNLIKGTMISLITMVLYKHVSPILKGNH